MRLRGRPGLHRGRPSHRAQRQGARLGRRAARFGTNWIGETELVKLREGRGPTADTEVAVSANVTKRTGYHVGAQIGVLTRQPKRTFTIVGIFG